MRDRIVQTSQAPQAIGPYSQGVEYGGLVFFSGILGLDPQSGELPDDFTSEVERIMVNLSNLLTSQSLSESDIIKTTIFLTDLKNFNQVNNAYQNFFTSPYPARSCVQVAGLPKEARVEIEVIAKKVYP